MSIALVGLIGCSGAEMAQPVAADSRAALTEVLSAVTARCPDLQGPPSSPKPSRDRLFVEAVILDVSSAVAEQASLSTLQRLPQTAPVQLVATPHLLADFDQPSQMVLGLNGETPEQLSLVRWSLLPRRADREVVLEVELALEPPASKHVPSPAPRTLRFAATVRENEPALARVEWDQASQRSLLIVFRTFEAQGEEDLRAIFQCMMQQHAQAVRERGR